MTTELAHADELPEGWFSRHDIAAYCDGRLQQRFEANLGRFGISDHVTVHVGSTLSAADSFGPGSLDLVFIDADHEYGAVAADIAAWLPKVKRGACCAVMITVGPKTT